MMTHNQAYFYVFMLRSCVRRIFELFLSNDAFRLE